MHADIFIFERVWGCNRETTDVANSNHEDELGSSRSQR
jgi:hypothetical protein